MAFSILKTTTVLYTLEECYLKAKIIANKTWAITAIIEFTEGSAEIYLSNNISAEISDNLVENKIGPS